MSLYKCTECNHEWDGKYEHPCRWCGGKPIIITESQYMSDIINQIDDILSNVKPINVRRDR
jgi:hypothetical protein